MFILPGSDIAFNRSESFRESLEHSMNPELQKVTLLLYFKFSVQMFWLLLKSAVNSVK